MLPLYLQTIGLVPAGRDARMTTSAIPSEPTDTCVMSVLLLAVEAASCCVHAPSSTDSARPEARQRKSRARIMILELHIGCMPLLEVGAGAEFCRE